MEDTSVKNFEGTFKEIEVSQKNTRIYKLDSFTLTIARKDGAQLVSMSLSYQSRNLVSFTNLERESDRKSTISFLKKLSFIVSKMLDYADIYR